MKSSFLNKKGQVFSQMQALGAGIASLVIVFAVIFLVIAQTQTQIVAVQGINLTNTSTWTTAYNATVELATAADDIPSWIPLIVIAVIGGILLSLVAMFQRR